VSADTAMVYAHNLWDGLPIQWTTIGLLGVFCLLTLMGLSESANVALTLFLGHLGVMAILIVFGTCAVFQNLEFVHQNIAANWHFGSGSYSIPLGIYFGFAKALLGVSGFESSSNYIEEQLPGVFPKTLRNMWAITAVLNTWLSVLLLMLLPLDPKAGALSIITNQSASFSHLFLDCSVAYVPL
jgi:amino acid transporter